MPTITMKVFPGRAQPANKPDITCQPYATRGDSPWAADVLNVAGPGICLAARRRFEPGTILLVRAKETGKEDWTQLVARVLNVSGAEEGKWAMDCQLTREPDEADLGVLRRAIRDASACVS
jgi:hypothetical protein